ncbi:MAG TPA: response regulator [Desulfurivibrionaceae bacterium]|nr:response regulator [Desulfurivibrionaceae bacterium]
MKLLIVDDEITARTVLREHLGRMLPKAEITEAENGAEALFLLLKHRPEMVLLDLLMPVTSGEVFLDVMTEWAAKQFLPELPRVVVITSFNDAAKLMELSNRPGVVKVLPKPITATTITLLNTFLREI